MFVSSPGPPMPRSLPALLALLLLAAPLTARAAVRLTASSTEARSGEVIAFRWAGLDEDVEEVELEYSVSGGHWLRLSPELEGEEREYRWHSPAGVAGLVRVRLRQGGRHEESVAAEVTLRLVCEAQREPAQGVRSREEWDLDRTVHGPVASQWGSTAPVWSAAHGLVAITTNDAPDAPRLEPQVTGSIAGERATVASLTARRAFEPRRLHPLRN